MDAVQYSQQNGIGVNKDLVFASYANLPITTYTAHPPLVSVEQYPYGQGEKAMEMMIDILNRKNEASFDPNAFQVEEIPATLVMHPGSRP